MKMLPLPRTSGGAVRVSQIAAAAFQLPLREADWSAFAVFRAEKLKTPELKREPDRQSSQLRSRIMCIIQHNSTEFLLTLSFCFFAFFQLCAPSFACG
jgi:hypothetical protein